MAKKLENQNNRFLTFIAISLGALKNKKHFELMGVFMKNRFIFFNMNREKIKRFSLIYTISSKSFQKTRT